jgi:hypothetical protein
MDRARRMSELAAAIERLYEAFANEPKPRQVSTCPCCLSPEEAQVLLNTPLRELSSDQLSSYGSSVLLTVGGVEDFRYFFPRLLDISIHESGWWPDREIVVSKLRLGEWQTWEDGQREAVIGVIREAFRNELPQAAADAGNIDAWLCGLALADADVTPFLAMLAEPENEEALFEYYLLNSAKITKGKLQNAFWGGNRDAQRPIVAWLTSGPIQEIVERIQRSKYGGR